MKKYFNLFDFSQHVDYKAEVLSGLTVAMTLIPEAVAFAFIAVLSSLTDLSAAFMMGLVSLFKLVLHNNLDLVVLIGVVLPAMYFDYDNAKKIRARKYIDEYGVKHSLMSGSLLYASFTALNKKFKVLIDLAGSHIVDISDIEALNKIAERYHKVGKKVHL